MGFFNLGGRRRPFLLRQSSGNNHTIKTDANPALVGLPGILIISKIIPQVAV